MVLDRVIGEGIIKMTYGKLEDGRGRDFIKMSTRIAELMAFAGLGYVVDMFPACESSLRTACISRNERFLNE